MLEKREFEKNEFYWRLSVAITLTSGAFTILVFTLLTLNYLQIRSADPINDPLIVSLRDYYSSAPQQDLAVAEQIRKLDLASRKAYFTTQYQLRVGGVLLLLGSVIFLASLKYTSRWKPKLPDLPETPTAEDEWIARVNSRQYLPWLGVTILAVGLLTAHFSESLLISHAAELKQGAPEEAVVEEPAFAAFAAPAWDDVLTQWPSFRGPGGYGVAHFTSAPSKWDVASGEGVKWNVKTPRTGSNSPVVWGKKLLFTGADETTREIFCFDTESGDLLWTHTLKPFPKTPAEAPDVTEDTGFAASTMVVHGNYAYAIFANGDLAAVDLEGNAVWGYNVGQPANHYGHASSLIAQDNLLYVQLDDNETPRLLALDAATGRQVWKADRESISWASPMLAPTPLGQHLILCSESNVDAYDPVSGTLLWTQECLGGEVAPSAAYSNGKVFAANEYAMASAIELSGTPEAVESKILWEFDDLLPEISSPVGDGERFYFATSVGELVCLDATSGEELWIGEIGEGFSSSPVLVGDKIYIADHDGTLFIVGTGAEFNKIAEFSFGEGIFATPAYLDGRMYVRTTDNLICIESIDA